MPCARVATMLASNVPGILYTEPDGPLEPGHFEAVSTTHAVREAPPSESFTHVGTYATSTPIVASSTQHSTMLTSQSSEYTRETIAGTLPPMRGGMFQNRTPVGNVADVSGTLPSERNRSVYTAPTLPTPPSGRPTTENSSLSLTEPALRGLLPPALFTSDRCYDDNVRNQHGLPSVDIFWDAPPEIQLVFRSHSSYQQLLRLYYHNLHYLTLQYTTLYHNRPHYLIRYYTLLY